MKLIEDKARQMCDPAPLDVVIQMADFSDTSEMCIIGSSLSPGRIDLTLNPFNPILDEDLEGQLQRTVFHEFHHVLRWDGPGYGTTLGEALVSEGLAQHFLYQAMKCGPEPWENALPRDVLARHIAVAAASFDDKGYSHPDWFFGSGELPQWLGYTLGMHIVGDYLLANNRESPLSLAHEPAESFRPYLAGIS